MSTELLALLEPSWPAAFIEDDGPLRLRRADGAGSRVNSARLISLIRDLKAADLASLPSRVATFYEAFGARALVQLSQDDECDAIGAFEAVDFDKFDPCALLIAPIEPLTELRVRAMTLQVETPVAGLEALWSDGDGGPERRAVMARAVGPKTMLAARSQDQLGGAAFVACVGETAFLHALHVAPGARRSGLGVSLLRRAARFAKAQGAERLAVSVREGNSAATELFTKHGFTRAGGYAYWRK